MYSAHIRTTPRLRKGPNRRVDISEAENTPRILTHLYEAYSYTAFHRRQAGDEPFSTHV